MACTVGPTPVTGRSPGACLLRLFAPAVIDAFCVSILLKTLCKQCRRDIYLKALLKTGSLTRIRHKLMNVVMTRTRNIYLVFLLPSAGTALSQHNYFAEDASVNTSAYMIATLWEGFRRRLSVWRRKCSLSGRTHN